MKQFCRAWRVRLRQAVGREAGDHRMERVMTETTEPKVILEAMAVIDKGLADMLHRELVSTDEVADLLLDVRSLLAASEVAVN